MNKDFPRIMTLLRKERGLSQKQAAADLEVTQALLSHYENGKRECGLDFLVRAADYYNVSVDYLLGRSPISTGAAVTEQQLPESSDSEKYDGSPSGLSVFFQKKLLTNSVVKGGVFFPVAGGLPLLPYDLQRWQGQRRACFQHSGGQGVRAYQRRPCGGGYPGAGRREEQRLRGRKDHHGAYRVGIHQQSGCAAFSGE